ncbi:MAG TPA: T9SS type A sorting domain-containing protein, partial [Bacteroidota bacterium]|nr:T9SS type A sorting domain-containing protein [Bacteroidota bacterium]
IIGVPDSTDTIGVEKRWNLIGPNSFTAPVGSITTDPPSILSTGFYAYDDTGYVLATDLIPGRGYWTKANNPGTLHFNVPSNAPAGTPKTSARDYLAGASSIVIEDGIGHYQTLYFGPPGPDEISSAETFEMPPVPPEAGFDARFASGRMVEIHDPRPESGLSYPIRVMSWQPTVTVTWNIKGDGSVNYGLGSFSSDGSTGAIHVIEHRGSLVLSADEAAGLRLIVGSRGLPQEFALRQNYPNPFNPSTTVAYELPRAERVSMVLFNTLGERVMTVLDGQQEAGYHAVTISAENLASGVYYYRLTAGSFTSARKMILLR